MQLLRFFVQPWAQYEIGRLPEAPPSDPDEDDDQKDSGKDFVWLEYFVHNPEEVVAFVRSNMRSIVAIADWQGVSSPYRTVDEYGDVYIVNVDLRYFKSAAEAAAKLGQLMRDFGGDSIIEHGLE